MVILFIDDDERRTKALREGLSVLGGFKVTYVETPHGAVETFKKNPHGYQAIVLDIMLPHYDKAEYKEFDLGGQHKDNTHGLYTGFQVYQQLKNEMEKANHRVPVVLLTMVDAGTVQECLEPLESKPELILYKRISVSEFVNAVEGVVHQTTDHRK